MQWLNVQRIPRGIARAIRELEIMPVRHEESHETALGSTGLIDSKTFRDQLLAINAEAKALCAGLSPDELGMRPALEKWSIAENLIHLCTTTEVFMPVLDRAIAESRQQGFLSAGPFRLGWYGRVLVWYVQPPPVIRLPAPKALRPRPDGPPEHALDLFLQSQTELLRRVEAASDIDLTRLRFSSPLASYIRMNLLEYFSVGNGHSRRHLWQAANVRRILGRERPAASRSSV